MVTLNNGLCMTLLCYAWCMLLYLLTIVTYFMLPTDITCCLCMTPLCAMQKLLSSFKGLESVQGYDGSQTVASIPGHPPTQLCHILTAIFCSKANLSNVLKPLFP